MASSTDNSNGMAGQAVSYNDASLFQFLIRQQLASVRTCMLSVVKEVKNNGGVEPVGYVDVQLLVGQTDNINNVIPHGVIYNVPYLRLQGGKNAIIIDPEVGDIGLAIFADRDISAVKRSKKASPPGSKRKHDISDALYIGGLLNGAPEQYIRFYDGGIEIKSPTQITIDSPNVTINGSLTVTEDATIKGINFSSHRHKESEGGITDGPQ